MEAKPWRLRQRARLNLLLAQNCAHATLWSLQDALGWKTPALLRAATNFEGGVVGCGETCGVVTGGILAIGATLGVATTAEPDAREEAILGLAARYLSWFEGRFGTSLCRERVQVDFHRARGLVRYLLPGDKLFKCLHHTGEAVAFLAAALAEETGAGPTPETMPGRPDGQLSAAGRPSDNPYPQGCERGRAAEQVSRLKTDSAAGLAPASGPQEPHCAWTVLKSIHSVQTLEDERVIWAATGLGGGLALNGAVCGALLGGILAIGLRYGYDVRKMSLAAVTRAFLRGHRSLLQTGREPPRPEAFARSKYLAEGFQERFGSLRCAEIAGRSTPSVPGARFFPSRETLGSFLRESDKCQAIMSWCTGEGRRLALE